MAQRSRLSTGLSGVAGEYFVAAELSRLGYIASITLRNAKGVDILASNQEATKSVAIQVKTNQGSSKEWVLSEKVEQSANSKIFFVLVCLNDRGAPEYHVVSAKDVAKHVGDDHKLWLNTPGRKGQQHRDTSMRKFSDKENKHLNRWDLLGLD